MTRWILIASCIGTTLLQYCTVPVQGPKVFVSIIGTMLHYVVCSITWYRALYSLHLNFSNYGRVNKTTLTEQTCQLSYDLLCFWFYIVFKWEKKRERKKNIYSCEGFEWPGEQYRETRRSFCTPELFLLLSFEKTALIITQTSAD